ASAFGHSVRLVSRSEQRAEIGSDYYHGALLDETSAAVHPARYVHGLARAALRAGAVVHEHTKALRCTRSGGGFRIETNRGEVHAANVLVASNGYTGGVTPRLRRRVIPVGSYMVA